MNVKPQEVMIADEQQCYGGLITISFENFTRQQNSDAPY
jgi:hypothetical protein